MQKFSLKKRVQSFGYAFSGVRILISTQHNAWIHFVATLLVIGAGFFLQVSKIEWLFLIISIVMVWAAEGFNTAIELLCNHVSPEHQPLIQKTKDVAAGAVLIIACGAAIIGLIIFSQYF